MQVFFLSLFDFSNKETQKPLLYILYKFYSFFFQKKKKKGWCLLCVKLLESDNLKQCDKFSIS